MKVKDFIDHLSKLDPEATVVSYDSLDTEYRPLGRIQKAFLVKEKGQNSRVSYKKPKTGPSEPVVLFYPEER